MVIALKKEDKIMVGVTIADSCIDMTEKDLSLEENIPFWKVKGNKDCYVFAEDLTFATDLLRHNDYVFKNLIDGNSIVENVVPKMKELFANNMCMINGKEWCTRILIIKENKMFLIDRYFAVSEVEDMVGLSFESYLLGGIDETADKSPEESILYSIRNFNRMRNRNLFPLLMFDNQTKKKKVYFK